MSSELEYYHMRKAVFKNYLHLVLKEKHKIKLEYKIWSSMVIQFNTYSLSVCDVTGTETQG